MAEKSKIDSYNNPLENSDKSLLDIFNVLYNWKKFLIINLIIVIVLSTIIAFIIPKTYKATATIMIPADDQSPLGGLSSLIGGKSSIAALGSRMFGISNTSEDIILGILNSRSALTHIIERFNLMDYYEIKDRNMDLALRNIRKDIYGEPNEYGMLDFNVITKDPVLSANIANYLIKMVDSSNIKFNTERAKNNRLFIEKRYTKNLESLKDAEEKLYAFQKKYGIVAVPEQLEVTVKAAAEIETQLIKKEMESFFIKGQFGEKSPQYMGIQQEIKLLRNKVDELKNSTKLSENSNVLFAFNKMPDIAIEYLRSFREVEVQQAILEILMPMYEQAKVEEQKSIPTVVVIDNAVPPQLKYGPKKAVIILGLFFLALFFFIPFVFFIESFSKFTDSKSKLSTKLFNFSMATKKLYRIS